jgi:hypothetical protein
MELTIWDDGCKFQADGCTCSLLHKIGLPNGPFYSNQM